MQNRPPQQRHNTATASPPREVKGRYNARMKLRTLGGLRLEGATFTQPKPLLLLAYLALEGPQARRHLAELFWPEGDKMKSLSMALTRLQQGAGEVLGVEAGRVWAKVDSDVRALLDALDKNDWQRVDALYGGAYLDGCYLADWSVELEEWVYSTREHLAERVGYALLNQAEISAKRENYQEAARYGERAYRLPGRGAFEPTLLKRLYLLLAAGSNLSALDVRQELESYEPSLQLSPEEARVTLAHASSAAIPSNLPVRRTSFIGRDPELTELSGFLADPACQLLTLLGPAGVGKTRLALQLAQEQLRFGQFADGVYFVSLDALLEPNLILPTLAHALQLSWQGSEDVLEQLSQTIDRRTMLLVCDNFEHLLDGATVLAELVNRCPRLTFLVTSRERLHLEAEQVFPLEGLPYPRAGALPVSEAEHIDAVQLFVQRAQRANPHFELNASNVADVIALCGLVEGLPLGLELAAGWTRVLSCADIVAELERNLDFLSSETRDIPVRHQSLRATFESSWGLLTPKEQAVLRGLAVFRGGFRREGASRVAGASISLLASLMDKSLLRVSQNGRYDRHSLLYQFTQEKLAEQAHEQACLQAEHASYYLELAERAEAQLRSREQVRWFACLNEELENIRAALQYLETQPDMTSALRLATALGYFWETQGHYHEGYGYLSQLLAKTAGTTVIRTKALLQAAHLSWRQGDHQRAQRLYEQSLTQAKALDDKVLWVNALLGLGIIAHVNRGDYDAARSYFQSGLELAKDSEEAALTAYALRQLGALNLDQAHYGQARSHYEESARLYDEVEDPLGRAKSLMNLATVLTYLGDLERAHRLNEESLELFRAVGDRHGEGVALLNLGVDASKKEDRQESIRLYQQSLALFRELGDQRMVSHLLNNLAGVFQTLSKPHQAQSLLTESLTLQRRIGDVSLISHALYLQGKVHSDLGERDKAYRCYQDCIDLCRKNSENWALMRVLEVLAKWYIEGRNYPLAKLALAEAAQLASSAGDHKTLGKVLETQAQLEAAQ